MSRTLARRRGDPICLINTTDPKTLKSTEMFATRALLQSCRITMFGRDTCGLCTQAKSVLSDVWDKRPFQFQEVNLSNSEKWRNLYDVSI